VAGRPDIAERLLTPWRELLGAAMRLEVLWYGLTGTGPGSLRLAARTLGLADQLGIPAVLTNAVRYLDQSQHRLANVLDATRLLWPINRRRLDCDERWLKGPAAMAQAADRISLGAGVEMEGAPTGGLGLIKLDVLGVRMQSAMAHAVVEIRRATGKEIDLDDGEQVPLDAPGGYAWPWRRYAGSATTRSPGSSPASPTPRCRTCAISSTSTST
jgi:DNA polymerase III alpha subunit